MSRLAVDNLTKEFPTRGEPLVVLRGISMELNTGDRVAITGPSGSGKSTLLNILGTLEPPTGGRVVLDGEDLATLPDSALAVLRNRRIGFVFQDHHLLPQCTVLENVLVPGIARGRVDRELVQRARELLARVGLASRMDHRPAELSGGERQRAALARALIHKPALLLADEPTGNLDRANAATVADLLLELQVQEGTMLVVATHSLALAARMGRRFELDDGRLKES
jgi:lipoprotein-releasing system ATP-binding protein